MEIPILPITDMSSFKIFYLVNKPVLIFISVGFFVIYLIISGILKYHWHNYGMRNPGIIFAQSIFFLVSIILFVILGLSIHYY